MNRPPLREWYDATETWTRATYRQLKHETVAAWHELQRLLSKLSDNVPQPPFANRRGKASDKPGNTTNGGTDYTVRDTQANILEKDLTLGAAIQQWHERTERQGHIVSSGGTDVTPVSNDTGQFVLFNDTGQQLATFTTTPAAIVSWNELTDKTGHIYDAMSGSDVTPQPETFLTEAQLAVAHEMVRANAPKLSPMMKFHQFRKPRSMSSEPLYVDVSMVHQMVNQLNTMALPIFEMTNVNGIDGLGRTKKVMVTRREIIHEVHQRIIEVPVPGPPKPQRPMISRMPTDDMDPARISRLTDVTRIFSAQLALPTPVFEQRLANRQLLRPTYFEEAEPVVQTETCQVYEEYVVPVVREWQEEIEVRDDEKPSQLLEMVVDISPSMKGDNICLAVAVATVLVCKHLDDGSRYLIRPFTARVGSRMTASSYQAKRALAGFFMSGFFQPIGMGTDVYKAYRQAVEDVKASATKDEKPEILLITDDDNNFDGTTGLVADLYDTDIKLHSLVMRAHHPSLRQVSSTYATVNYYDGTIVINNPKPER